MKVMFCVITVYYIIKFWFSSYLITWLLILIKYNIFEFLLYIIIFRISLLFLEKRNKGMREQFSIENKL